MVVEDLKFEKRYRYLGFFLLLAMILYSFFIARRNGDFQVFLEASELLAEGKNPYGVWLLERNCLYYYSPLWAMILMPIAKYHYFVKVTWLLLNIFFLHKIWSDVKAFISDVQLSKKQLFWAVILLLAASHRFILYNFMMIQMTVFILWVIFTSLKLFSRDQLFLGALLLAFAINVKILAIVAVPYLVYRSYYKAALLTVLFFLLYLILPAMYFGWGYNLELHQSWWGMINPNSKEHQFDVQLGPHSLTALLPSLLMKTNGDFDVARNILNLPLSYTLVVVDAIRGGLIVLCLYFFKFPMFVKEQSKLKQFWELSYLLLLIPLIFPHQQKYAFFLAAPAQFYLIIWAIKTSRGLKGRSLLIGLFVLSFLLMTMTSDAFIGKYINTLTQYYKLITYGAIILIPLLIFASPKKMQSLSEEAVA